MPISKVLCVDDSPTDLANIETIVSQAGYVVITATNGLDALQKARHEKPDVIFLDILMPEMDGFEACRKLCSDGETKHIPIVFVTSKGQKADRIWAQMQGGKDLVAKPYVPSDILDQLSAC